MSGVFPMTFANDISVNSDEYKTSKIVLTRIDSISGEKKDTFEMGVHSTDYDEVTDQKRIKYKDNEAIVDGSPSDIAQVTLTNGGSC